MALVITQFSLACAAAQAGRTYSGSDANLPGIGIYLAGERNDM
jgi:hypothetical protein